MLQFRSATRSDIPDILNIYAPFIKNTTVTFEYEIPSIEEFTARFEKITAEFPWLVCEEDGRIIGYAYASHAFTRAAFRWDADLSVYILPEYQNRGIGKEFYRLLEKELYDLGYHNIYALITGENKKSCRFHQVLGYELLGTLPSTGFKHGTWLDLYWYGKRLREKDAPSNFPKKKN